MKARWVVAAATLALAGCATASGPPAAATATEVSAGGASALRGARTVWVDAAIRRTGRIAAGLDDEAPAVEIPSGGAAHSGAGADVSAELQDAVRRTRGLELAATRDAADLVLYFEQADRLRCWGCRQPEDLWHWWGLVADRAGHEVASLHGETAGGPEEAARDFARAVKSLARPSRRNGGGAER